MSSIDAWSFNSLSLKHLASVKTVQVLYRRSGALHGFKESINNVFQEHDISKCSPIMLVHPILTRFNSYLDKLMLPTKIKDDLSHYLWQMLQDFLDSNLVRSWVRAAVDLDMAEKMSQKMLRILKVIMWDRIGRTDWKKLIECLTWEKETISFSHWAALCDFCSEDYVRKFADTLDWKKAKFEVFITIFWYYTIYGTFPTEDMFNSSADFTTFQEQRQQGYFNKININRCLLVYCIQHGNIFMAKFACSRLTKSQISEIISSRMEIILNKTKKDAAVYLLAQIDFNCSSIEPMNDLKYLLSWPYVVFIDSWIDKFRNGDIDQFVGVFNVLVEKRRSEKAMIENYLEVNYYVPCEKLWSLCCQKFDLQDQLIFKIVSLILNSEDIMLCRIVMKGSTSAWRIIFLDYLKDCEEGLEFMSNQEFCDEFSKEILINDEEKDIFMKICRGVFGHKRLRCET